MNISRILRTRQWVWGRRLALVALILFLGFRNYGNSISAWLRGPDQEHDVVITQAEFHPDIGESRPGWIIGLRNVSSKYTYDKIELEATYKDETGKVLEKDKLMVRQKLVPGDEQLIASTDFKNRPGATHGTLRVLGASSVKP
jgi:hypothetical protein